MYQSAALSGTDQCVCVCGKQLLHEGETRQPDPERSVLLQCPLISKPSVSRGDLQKKKSSTSRQRDELGIVLRPSREAIVGERSRAAQPTQER